MLASLVLAALVAAGLFFGLVYPSFSSSGSADGETRHESVGDQIGEGTNVDDAWAEGSSHTGEGEHGEDPTEDHEEHDRDGGEHH